MDYNIQITAALILLIEKMNFDDKSGVPTYIHPLRVGMAASGDPRAVIVGLLHDIIEDTDVTLDDLYYIGFDNDLIEAIHVITHPKNEPYVDYANRVKKNRLACKVKRLDIADNRWRLSSGFNKIDSANASRMLNKWQKMLDIIGETD